jgi:hypothetical protein
MKNTKSSAFKKVVVQCSNFWKDEFDIDSNIHDDILLEAATRAVEKRNHNKNFRVAVVFECYEKKNIKIYDLHFCYNTYFIMVNAGLYEKAEMLRLNFKKKHGVDLQKESLKGDNDGPDNYPPTTTESDLN